MRFQALTILLCFAITIAISQTYPVKDADALYYRGDYSVILDANGINHKRSNLIAWTNDGVGADHHRKRAAPPPPDGGVAPKMADVPHHLPRKRDGSRSGETPQTPPGQLSDPNHPHKRSRDPLTPVIPNGKDVSTTPTIPITDLPPK